MSAEEEIAKLKNQANALKYGVWVAVFIVAVLAVGRVVVGGG